MADVIDGLGHGDAFIPEKDPDKYVTYQMANEIDPHGRAPHEKGAKLDQGKPDWSLLPWGILHWYIDVATYGKAKYTRGGWREVPDGLHRYEAAMFRHWAAYMTGRWLDAESGLPHLAHFLWNAVTYCWFAKRRVDHEQASQSPTHSIPVQPRPYQPNQANPRDDMGPESEGLEHPAGDGGVRLKPGRAVSTRLCLQSKYGDPSPRGPSGDVANFGLTSSTSPSR